MSRLPLRGLLHHPGYAVFVAGATLARVANEMFAVGVVLHVLERTGSPGLAGITLASVTLPSFVSGPLLGAWLDLTGRRRTLMVLNQCLMVVTVGALLLFAGVVPDWTLPLFGVVAGVTYPLSFGGFTSLIPSLVPEELLTPANALETSSFNAALIAGPALAGTLAGLFGPAAALTTEIALTAAALVLILRVRGLDKEPNETPDEDSLWRVARAGLRQIVEVPQLRGVTFTGALNLGGFGLFTVAFPFFAVELGGERSQAGYMWAAFALGSTLGALIVARYQDRLHSERVVLAGVGGAGLAILLWPLAPSLTVALALIALAGLFDGPGLAATFAVRQERVPARLHGQVFTTAASLKVGSFALGAALAGPAVLGLGVGGALVAAGLTQLVAVAGGALLMRVRASERVAAAPG